MILVTGSTGFIGRSLMTRLARENIPTRAYNGRINNPQSLREQLDGIETVIHLAGSEARGRNRLLQHVDVEGTERLIEEARRARVRHLIVPGRIGADPNAIQPLLRAKGEIERLVERSPIPYTILRTASLYGRTDRYFELIISLAQWSWPLVWLPGGGTMAVQPLWVEDYVRCLVQTLERPDLVGKTLTLAGDERFTYRELVSLLLTATNKPRLMIKLPLALMPPITSLMFRWWYWPGVSRYFADRFFVPEVVELDSVTRHFGFRPARVAQSIAYLNHQNLRWRLFRH